MGLVELHIAKEDLSKGLRHYESAVNGSFCDPYNGSSFGDWLRDIVQEKWDSVPREEDEQGFPMDNFGVWYPSQFDHLEEIVTEMLSERDLKAIPLLGKQLAERIDVLHKAREYMIPRLSEIFPLQWMPVYDSDYEPPATVRG